VEIRAREMRRIKDRLNAILAKHTGKKEEEIERDTDRDRFMSPEEAKKYGLIDKVIV
jgi:ATP-dependent Clp protease protease subunit